MKFKIRPGLLFDIPIISDFQLRMAFETEGLKLESDIVEKGVSAVFDDPSKGKYWLAEKDDRIVEKLNLPKNSKKISLVREDIEPEKPQETDNKNE